MGAWPNFINAACISRFHGPENVPKSRHLTFAEGSREVRVRCYVHGPPRDGKNVFPQGWYNAAERVLLLSRPFSWQGV